MTNPIQIPGRTNAVATRVLDGAGDAPSTGTITRSAQTPEGELRAEFVSRMRTLTTIADAHAALVNRAAIAKETLETAKKVWLQANADLEASESKLASAEAAALEASHGLSGFVNEMKRYRLVDAKLAAEAANAVQDISPAPGGPYAQAQFMATSTSSPRITLEEHLASNWATIRTKWDATEGIPAKRAVLKSILSAHVVERLEREDAERNAQAVADAVTNEADSPSDQE